ncbi:MAG: DUF488 domain-containing protein [Chitinophagaceae bacterium]|nr:DUF488 domain-containing protein [Chitinophagaceae bacterium]MCW5905148.1 DUF488 domain-containing protein [Chitinophagaceae bacterium]
MNTISIKRIYEQPDKNDGYRILIDRLWPRGIKKETAAIDEWIKDIAPSDVLRKWFGHKPELFEEFKNRYKKELATQTSVLKRIQQIAKKQKITLLYAAKDTEHNNAVVLYDVLNKTQIKT